MKVLHKKGDPTAQAQPAKSSTAAKPGIRIVNRAPPAPVVSQEEIESGKVAKLLERLTLGEHDQHCDGHTDIDGVVAAAGFASLQANGLLSKLKAQTEDLGNADAREAALLAFKQLCQSVGRQCEPYVVPLLPVMLDRTADKSGQVRDAALGACRAVVAILCPHAVELVLPGGHTAAACITSSNGTACASSADVRMQRRTARAIMQLSMSFGVSVVQQSPGCPCCLQSPHQLHACCCCCCRCCCSSLCAIM